MQNNKLNKKQNNNKHNNDHKKSIDRHLSSRAYGRPGEMEVRDCSPAQTDVHPARPCRLAFTTYNMAHSSRERFADVLQQFGHGHAMLLSRTSDNPVAVAGGVQAPWRIQRTDGHLLFRFPTAAKTTTFSNKACGVAEALPRKHFKPRDVKKVLPPPAELRGRVAGVVVKTPLLHVAFFVIYSWPGPCDHRKVECVKHICNLLRAQIAQLPRRVVPLLGGSLNAWFGKELQQGVWLDMAGKKSISIANPERELLPRQMYRTFLRENSLALYNTHSRSPCAHNSQTGTPCKRIDYGGGLLSCLAMWQRWGLTRFLESGCNPSCRQRRDRRLVCCRIAGSTHLSGLFWCCGPGMILGRARVCTNMSTRRGTEMPRFIAWRLATRELCSWRR